jgi:hypothetical protein
VSEHQSAGEIAAVRWGIQPAGEVKAYGAWGPVRSDWMAIERDRGISVSSALLAGNVDPEIAFLACHISFSGRLQHGARRVKKHDKTGSCNQTTRFCCGFAADVAKRNFFLLDNL